MIATYNEDGSVNVMNAAWGTMQERDTVVLNLTESHKTVKNIKAGVPLLSVLQMHPMLWKRIISVLNLETTLRINLKTAV